MRLIRNVSPGRIKVNISVLNPEGMMVNFELKYGECVLVHDTSVATKPIIVQTRKGNINIIDKFLDDMIPYQKYPAKEDTSNSEEIDTGIITKTEEYDSSEEHFENGPSSIEEVTTESETSIIVPLKNKGGRPKGSFKKKGKGRPKKTKNKKKNTLPQTDSSEEIENKTENE